jgi:hypothetical protein
MKILPAVNFSGSQGEIRRPSAEKLNIDHMNGYKYNVMAIYRRGF